MKSRKFRKSRRGGLLGFTNSNKTYKNNYDNWKSMWSKKFSWNADYDWPGKTNFFASPKNMGTYCLPGDLRKKCI